MKIAVLIHKGCLANKKEVEVATRQALHKKYDTFLIDSDRAESQWVRDVVSRFPNVKLISSDDIRRDCTWITKIWRRLFPVSNAILLVDGCDSVLVFWDKTPNAKKLVQVASSRGVMKNVLIHRVG